MTGWRGAVVRGGRRREAPLFSVTCPCLLCFQLLHPKPACFAARQAGNHAHASI